VPAGDELADGASGIASYQRDAVELKGIKEVDYHVHGYLLQNIARV
jgi:hypothetical protein